MQDLFCTYLARHDLGSEFIITIIIVIMIKRSNDYLHVCLSVCLCSCLLCHPASRHVQVLVVL